MAIFNYQFKVIAMGDNLERMHNVRPIILSVILFISLETIAVKSTTCRYVNYNIYYQSLEG
jgi:hypothetical protein